MIAIGIDCGTRKATLFGENLIKHIEVPKSTRSRELWNIREEIIVTLSKHSTEVLHLYIEESVVAGARNLRTSLMLAQTVGAVLSIGLRSTLVPVSSWKKTVLANGNAKKEDVAAWFKHTYPDQSDWFSNQDVCDAAAIYAYGRSDLEVAEQLRSGSAARRSGP